MLTGPHWIQSPWEILFGKCVCYPEDKLWFKTAMPPLELHPHSSPLELLASAALTLSAPETCLLAFIHPRFWTIFLQSFTHCLTPVQASGLSTHGLVCFLYTRLTTCLSSPSCFQHPAHAMEALRNEWMNEWTNEWKEAYHRCGNPDTKKLSNWTRLIRMASTWEKTKFVSPQNLYTYQLFTLLLGLINHKVLSFTHRACCC